ncbi:hypothetical protein GCM10023149_42770 [Mucilaginibacter gynuensis]|uniref:Lipocalin-like domain-containing protein n=1 Tax=Mucilaginibacter gynuensis TaxID=1302236 RepID=A0ABP8H6K4_9SPHI
MPKNIILAIIGALVFLLSACGGGINAEKLRGKWKYIKVFKPNANPPDTVSSIELDENKPYIEFSGDDKLKIIWGGEVLSHGTYKIEASNLRYREEFDNGQSRQFPFYVSELTDKKIIFETVGADGSRVEAVKE